MDERLQFVVRRLAGEPMAELFREFGISRKTGYKILSERKTSPAVSQMLERAKALHAFMTHRGTLSSAWRARRSDTGDAQSR